MKACIQWLLLACILIFLAPSLQLPVQGLATDRPSQNNNKPPRRAGGAAGAGRSKDWFSVRKSGVKIKSSSPKPPRWEKEGDALYHPNSNAGQIVHSNTNSSSSSSSNSDQKALTFSEAKELLAQLSLSTPTFSEDTKSLSTKNTVTKEKTAIDKPPSSSSPFLWGTLSVGPVWKSRLVHAGCVEPTPVQTAAYSVILKKQNAVIASPTGSGKSLAFLVPLLTSRQLHARVLLVTPTVELALQLQNQVQELVSDTNTNTGTSSLLHVLGTSPKPDENELQLLPFVGDAPLIAGTPRFLRRMVQELELAKSGAFGPKMEALSESIRSNLCGVVLDEADRLLKTELAARNLLEKQQAKEESNNNNNSDTKKKRKFTPWTPTQTEQLLGELPVSLDKIQIICASATVGRTLRRQLMQLTGAASMDKAATLVTGDGDVRTKKDSQKRKSSLIPSTLKHCYRLLLAEGGDDTTTSTATHASTLDSLWTTLQSIPPAPTLVFPGRVGVDLVVKALTDRGLQDIRTLSPESLKAPPSLNVIDGNWNATSVYVVNDKFGRGLDLSGVEYVVLLSPPSSAAGYTHLAGRTGRNGQSGTAITLVRPKEAPKLVAIAQALGLDFTSTEDIGSSSSGGGSQEEKNTQVGIPSTEKQIMNQSSNEKDVQTPSTEEYPWAGLTDSALKRKTIWQLLEYLVENVSTVHARMRRYCLYILDAFVLLLCFFPQGVSLQQEDGGPKLKKADIISAVYELHGQ
jgi:superfamily II DNA/RNA helicase